LLLAENTHTYEFTQKLQLCENLLRNKIITLLQFFKIPVEKKLTKTLGEDITSSFS